MSDQSSDLSFEALQRRKLSLEIQNLQRPYWQRAAYLAALIPIILSVTGLAAGWATGFFKRERAERLARIEELARREEDLRKVVQLLEAQKTRLQMEHDEAEGQLEATKVQLREMKIQKHRAFIVLGQIPEVLTALHSQLLTSGKTDKIADLEAYEETIEAFLAKHSPYHEGTSANE